MFRSPEDIASKPLVQHFLENFIIDFATAPINRLLILQQTQPGLEIHDSKPHEKDEKDEKHEKPATQGIAYFARHIYKQEGILGFWKGFTFDVIKSGTWRIFHSFFLHLYEPLLNIEDASKNNAKTISFEFLFLCAIQTSLQIIQHPFKVIRTRLSALEKPDDPHSPKGFERVSQCVSRIWAEDGWKGFYRGFGMALLESFANVVSLTVQKIVARHYVSTANDESSFWGSLKDVVTERSAGSIVSVLLSVSGSETRKKVKTIVFQLGKSLGNLLLIYPLRVLQHRLIMHKDQWRVKQTSVRGLIREMWKYEGLGGFYAGAMTQIGLFLGITLAMPYIDSLAGVMLPEAVKDAAKVGDASEAVENTVTVITDTVEEKVGETVEKIKDMATEQKK